MARSLVFAATIMEGKMKYLFACLIIPTVQTLFLVVIMIGALYFGVENLLKQMKTNKLLK